MNGRIVFFVLLVAGLATLLIQGAPPAAQAPAADPAAKVIVETDCTAAKLGSTIPVSAIGEPVAAVTLATPRWVAATGNAPAYCSIDGAMAPTDTSPNGRPINFRVILPSSWSRRAAQIGGGGMNGSIPGLTGAELQRGFATYGSYSGHQQGGGGGGLGGPGGLPGRGGPGGPGGGAGPAGARGFAAQGPAGAVGRGGPGGAGPGAGGARGGGPVAGAAAGDWTLSDEAIKNLGYAQMKKTHDAAMVLMERLYGERPRYNYYIGSSQGGREALTVAQRYPADYNGIAANVPIINFSSLMLAPEWIRIQEKPAANWVPPAKVEAIRAEFVRQCDKLDGLADGIMNNYMACRAIFDMSQGDPNRNPWAAKRCPNNVDPNPQDTSAAACFTDGQISTLKVVYSWYKFATPLANGVKTFGMWVPNIDPSGSGLIANTRYRGQEGAAANAANHSHLGVAGVTGFLMKDSAANPLDYVEGGPLNKRRQEISPWLDSTNPDLGPFAKRGGKMIVAIGTNDTLASPGAQLDYYQSVLDTLGRAAVDEFARFYVLPQTGHGLSGNTYTMDGDGKTIRATQIPSRFDRVAMLVDWVEKGTAPQKSATATGNAGSLPLCSYPAYPKYNGGQPTEAASYTCAAP